MMTEVAWMGAAQVDYDSWEVTHQVLAVSPSFVSKVKV